MTVRIVMVDDHEVVRAGMRLMLEDNPDVEIVGDIVDRAQALDFERTLEANPHFIVEAGAVPVCGTRETAAQAFLDPQIYLHAFGPIAGGHACLL